MTPIELYFYYLSKVLLYVVKVSFPRIFQFSLLLPGIFDAFDHLLSKPDDHVSFIIAFADDCWELQLFSLLHHVSLRIGSLAFHFSWLKDFRCLSLHAACSQLLIDVILFSFRQTFCWGTLSTGRDQVACSIAPLLGISQSSVYFCGDGWPSLRGLRSFW